MLPKFGKYLIVLILIFGGIVFIRQIMSYKKNIDLKTQSTLPPKEPEREVYIGFWVGGFWDNATKKINSQVMREMESKIGKKLAIANYFRGWEHLGKEEEIVKELNDISSGGWMPMVSTNPYFFSECLVTHKTLYKALADGDCDEYFHKIGKALSKVEKPFFLRFAWEMNVNSMEWSIERTGSTPADFISAWRRFHDIVKEENAKNVVWVFAPQIETRTTTRIAELYPGDSYVDWVGLDGYNWGTTQSWSGWQSFKSIYNDSYIQMREIAPSKPLMLAEVNTVSIGGDQAEWYRDMLSEVIPDEFTDVDAVVFFHEDKIQTEGVRWLIDTTPETLNVFKESIANPIYKSKMNN